MALSDHDAPEPDIVLTSEPRGEGLIPLYSVALVLEIADTTLGSDMKRKATIYARAGVPEYWDADAAAEVIHHMRAPVGEAYAERREVAFGEQVESATVAGLTVETAGI